MNRPDFESPFDTWMGHSRGRWEGKTLVVDVTSQVPDTWFDSAGNFHSGALRVEERYTPMGENALMYEATIEDPELPDRVGEHFRFHERAVPDDAQNLVLGDVFARPRGEMNENAHGLGLEPHPVALTLQDILSGIDLEGAEGEEGLDTDRALLYRATPYPRSLPRRLGARGGTLPECARRS